MAHNSKNNKYSLLFIYCSCILILLSLNPLFKYCFADELNDQSLIEIIREGTSQEQASIDVGNKPENIVIKNVFEYDDRKMDQAYVANSNGTVSIISTYSNSKIKDIEVGGNPTRLVIDDMTNYLYLTKSDSGNISVINGNNNSKIKDIDVGGNPRFIYIADRLYVSNDEGYISVIDRFNQTILNKFHVDNPDHLIVIDDKIYVASSNNGNITVISKEDGKPIKDIEVGLDPSYLAYDDHRHTLYVANSDEGTISTIDTTEDQTNNDIPLDPEREDPGQIIVIPYLNAVFVLNTVAVEDIDKGSVSIINITDNSTRDNIEVGLEPSYMRHNPKTDMIYVANTGENSVSVISAVNFTKMDDIEVGNAPSHIAIDERSNTIYVANKDSNTISVINGVDNKVVARVLFKVSPINSGYILCDSTAFPVPIEQYLYISAEEICRAIPNKGYEFQNWQENLEGNSSRIIKGTYSNPPVTIYDYVFGFVDSAMKFLGIREIVLGYLSIREPVTSLLPISNYGSFTANFKESPPPVPTEYWSTLLGFVLTTILGTVLIPTFIVWRKSRSQGSKLDYYHHKIDSLQEDGRLNEKDIDMLDYLSKTITNEYTKGKINKEQYDKLAEEISINYNEIFKNKIDSLGNLSQESNGNEVATMRSIIDNAFAKGKINELHYNLLQKKLSKYEK